ncbi:hypothetical protein HWV62_29378 [Athelia sp. TMB]|nr:hypothetical protein HWV62_29378 [Athelia sp. TMB]
MSTFSRDTISKNGYLLIAGKVYDGKAYGLSDHPGGKVLMTQLGRDATDVFRTFHPDSAYEQLANFYIGDLEPSNEPEADPFTLAMRKLDDSFRKQGFYETSHIFYVTIQLITFALLGCAAAGLKYFGHTIPGVLLSALCLALFFQQSGWLAHDYCHSQVFNSKALNHIGALVFGPSWWTAKHNTHHSTPNVHGSDPDINTAPFLAWSDNALEMFADVSDEDLKQMFAKVLITHQVFCYFPLLTFARLMWSYASLRVDFGPASTASLGERASLLFHWTWVVALSTLAPTLGLRVLFLFAAIALNGQFLALVFALNHNGMAVFTRAEWAAMPAGFFELQIRTGRDIASTVFGEWFSGGLGQQVTHHLFPRMPRHRYPAVQPQVKALCEEYGVPYHQTGFFEGTKEVLGRLNQVATAARVMLKETKKVI